MEERNAALNQPFFTEADGYFFLYHPDTKKVYGQYASEEEMQTKSLWFFAEKAKRLDKGKTLP